MTPAPELPITEQQLLTLGFERRVKDGQELFVRSVNDVDMGEREWAYISLQRGNGTDPDCWNVRFTRQDGNTMRPPDSLMIRHGLHWMWQVANLQAVFWPEGFSQAKQNTPSILVGP